MLKQNTPVSSEFVGNAEDGRRVAAAVESGATLLDIVLSVAQSVIAFASFLLGLLLVVVIAYLISAFTIRHAHDVLETLEYTWRCGLHAEISEVLPLLDTARNYYNTIVCWTNSLGLINQLLTTKFIIRESKKCAISALNGSIFKVIEDISQIINNFLGGFLQWIVTLPFLNRGSFPAYPILSGLKIVAVELYKVLNCLCNALDILWRPVLHLLSSSNLHCGVHNLANGILGLANTVISSAFDIAFNNIVDLFTSGSILDIFAFTVRKIETSTIPAFRLSFQKICAGIDALGRWVSGIINAIVCTITIEISNPQEPDDVLLAAFDVCNSDLSRVDASFLVSRLLITAVRLVQVVVELIFGIGGGIFDNFYAEGWQVDYLWDSIRVPLPLSSIATNAASLVDQPLFYYGNVSCNDTFTLDSGVVACAECGGPALGNSSLDTSLYAFCIVADDVLEPAINVRIVTPILYDTVFPIVRVLVSVAKLAIDTVRKGAGSLYHLSQRDTFDRVINELGGPPNRLEGLVAAPDKILAAIFPNDPSLLAISNFITHLLKFIVELLRFVAYSISGFCKILGDVIINVTPTTPLSIGLVDYFCVDGSTCLNPEVAFTWLRNPRSYFSLGNDYIFNAFGPTPQKGSLENLCSIIDLEFLSSLNIPELLGLDISQVCCGIYTALRTLSDIVILIINFFLVLFQTLVEVFTLNQRILILEYYSCLNPNDLCSTINIVLSDIQDFGTCGCLFVEGINNIVPNSPITPGDLRCICSALNGVGSVVSNVLVLARRVAQLILGALQCIDINTRQFKNTPECTDVLPDVAVDILDGLDNILTVLSRTVDSIVCSFSLIFAFDCINAPPAAPCISIEFEICVRNKCPTYFPVTPLGNDLPSPIQLDDCYGQCGSDDCAACYLDGQAFLNSLDSQNIPYSTNCDPPCSGLVCRPSDKFKSFFASVADLIAALIRVVLDFIRTILIISVNEATNSNINSGNPISTRISDFIQTTFGRIGRPLFGREAIFPFVSEYGLFQNFGSLLNCIVGPPGCSQTTNTNPCIGNLLISIANIVRRFYGDVTQLIVLAIRVVESFINAVLAGGVSTATNTFLADFRVFFEFAITFIFRTIFQSVVQTIGLITDIIASIIASLIQLVFGGGSTYTIVYNGLRTVFGIFTTVLRILIDPFSLFSPAKRSIIQTAWTINPVIVDIYKLSPELVSMLTNTTALLANTTNTTYCYRVLETVIQKSKTNASLDLFEELSYQTCYALIVTPILENSRSAQTQIPDSDVLYNPATMIDTLTDTLFLLAQKEQWDSISDHVGDSMYIGSDGTSNNIFMSIYNGLPILSPPSRKRSNITVDSVVNTSSYMSFKEYVEAEYPALAIKTSASAFLNKYGVNDHRTLFDARLNATYLIMKHIITGGDASSILGSGTNSFEKMTWFWNLSQPADSKKRGVSYTSPRNSTPVYETTPDTSGLVPLMYATVFTAIPKSFAHFRNVITNMNYNTNHSTPTLDRAAYLAPLSNVTRMMYNVYGFRMSLIYEVISYIATKRYNQLKDSVDIFINSSINNYTRTVEKRALDPVFMHTPTLPEKILIIATKLKSIRQFEKYIPEPPQKLVQLANIRTDALKKRSLINVSCDCNCSILDTLLQELVDIATFCYERDFLNSITLPPVYNGSLVVTVPLNQSSPEQDVVVSFFNNLVGFDLFATIISFASNFNVDLEAGPVGFNYFVKRLDIISFYRIRCSRVNLSGNFGIGLEAAIVVALLLVIGLFGIYFIIPPVGRLLTIIIILIFGGLTISVFLSVVTTLAWNYQANCLVSPDNSIWAFIGLPFELKMLPERAANDVYALFRKFIIQECPVDNLFGKFAVLVDPQVNYSCPMVCPTRVTFTKNFNIQSQFAYFGIFLLRNFPGVSEFLLGSCLVRGGCLNGFITLGQMPHVLLVGDGILSPLFTGYNTTHAIDPVLYPELDAVYSLNPAAVVVVSGIVLLSLLLGIQAVRIVIGLLRFLVLAFQAPPIYWLYSK